MSEKKVKAERKGQLRCGNCAFAVVLDGDKRFITCHARPPQIVSTARETGSAILSDEAPAVAMMPVTQWPILGSDEWCASFTREEEWLAELQSRFEIEVNASINGKGAPANDG